MFSALFLANFLSRNHNNLLLLLIQLCNALSLNPRNLIQEGYYGSGMRGSDSPYRSAWKLPQGGEIVKQIRL